MALPTVLPLAAFASSLFQLALEVRKMNFLFEVTPPIVAASITVPARAHTVLRHKVFQYRLTV